MEQREIIEALQTDFSVRRICETLSFNPSNFYYYPKQDPCEADLRSEVLEYQRKQHLEVTYDHESEVTIIRGRLRSC